MSNSPSLSYNDYSYDSYDSSYDDISSFIDTSDLLDESSSTTVPTTTTTTTVSCAEVVCKLELFSKTLLRGKKVELTEDVSDLSDLDFNNKVISLRVTGPCTWSLYKDTDYAGDSVSFVETSSYKDAVALGKVFRKASSAKKSGSCS